MSSELEIDIPEPAICDTCNTHMIWRDCECDDGLVPGGNDDEVPCPICDGDGGYWECPRQKEHTLPLFPYPRLRDLPEAEREAFKKRLTGQTVPVVHGVPMDEQDFYYPWDYDRWKRGLPVID